MFSELRQWHKPDVISYSASISACGAGGDWGRAFGLLEEMKEERTWPDVITYSAVITACEKGMEWGLALEFLKGMWNSVLEPDLISHSAAILACDKSGRLDSSNCSGDLDTMRRMLIVPISLNDQIHAPLHDSQPISSRTRQCGGMDMLYIVYGEPDSRVTSPTLYRRIHVSLFHVCSKLAQAVGDAGDACEKDGK